MFPAKGNVEDEDYRRSILRTMESESQDSEIWNGLLMTEARGVKIEEV